MDERIFNRLLNTINKDEKSFDIIYNFYYGKIVNYLLDKYGKEIAENVAQDFFLKLLRQNKDFDYINYPTAWVYACCRNLAKNKVLKTYSEIELTDISEDFDYDDCVDEIKFDNNSEKVLDLYDGLKQLDYSSKRLIYLHYWLGYGLDEIAKIFHINYATLRQRHKRLIKKIKKFLN